MRSEVIRKSQDGIAVREHGEEFQTQKIGEFSSHKVPMIQVIETITGTVGIEIQIGQIIENIVNQTLHNKAGKATALSGLIRGQVLVKKIETERKPSRWAEGGES